MATFSLLALRECSLAALASPFCQAALAICRYFERRTPRFRASLRCLRYVRLSALPVSSHGICCGGGICDEPARAPRLEFGDPPDQRAEPGPGEPMRTTSASEDGPVGMSFFGWWWRRSLFLFFALPREGKASESSTGGTSEEDEEELWSRSRPCCCWRELGCEGVILKPGGGPSRLTPPSHPEPAQ